MSYLADYYDYYYLEVFDHFHLYLDIYDKTLYVKQLHYVLYCFWENGYLVQMQQIYPKFTFMIIHIKSFIKKYDISTSSQSNVISFNFSSPKSSLIKAKFVNRFEWNLLSKKLEKNNNNMNNINILISHIKFYYFYSFISHKIKTPFYF